jgi:hypothetical protein
VYIAPLIGNALSAGIGRMLAEVEVIVDGVTPAQPIRVVAHVMIGIKYFIRLPIFTTELTFVAFGQMQ